MFKSKGMKELGYNYLIMRLVLIYTNLGLYALAEGDKKAYKEYEQRINELNGLIDESVLEAAAKAAGTEANELIIELNGVAAKMANKINNGE